ncbi:hypothetical protein PSPO01_14885 [Paraphaeosphaeria sporulosa]
MRVIIVRFNKVPQPQHAEMLSKTATGGAATPSGLRIPHFGAFVAALANGGRTVTKERGRAIGWAGLGWQCEDAAGDKLSLCTQAGLGKGDRGEGLRDGATSRRVRPGKRGEARRGAVLSVAAVCDAACTAAACRRCHARAPRTVTVVESEHEREHAAGQHCEEPPCCNSQAGSTLARQGKQQRGVAAVAAEGVTVDENSAGSATGAPSPPASALTSILASRWSLQYLRKSPRASSERVQPIHTAREESISPLRHSPLSDPVCLAFGFSQQRTNRASDLATALVPDKTHPSHKQSHSPTAFISQRRTCISSPTPLPSLPHSSQPRRVPTDRHFTLDLDLNNHHPAHLGSPYTTSHAPSLDRNHSPITTRTSLAPVSADARSAPTGDSALS